MPAPPDDLNAPGLQIWREATVLQWIRASDRLAVEQLARLEDEAADLRAQRELAGHLLTKPIVTPKGEVVGDELYINPVTAELRRLEKSIDALRRELGLSPLSRARLGVAVVEAETGAQRLARMRTAEISEGDDPWADDPRVVNQTQHSGRSSADGLSSTSSTDQATSRARKSRSTKSSESSSGSVTRLTRPDTPEPDEGSTAEPS